MALKKKKSIKEPTPKIEEVTDENVALSVAADDVVVPAQEIVEE